VAPLSSPSCACSERSAHTHPLHARAQRTWFSALARLASAAAFVWRARRADARCFGYRALRPVIPALDATDGGSGRPGYTGHGDEHDRRRERSDGVTQAHDACEELARLRRGLRAGLRL
jgi:hypothetical protein